MFVLFVINLDNNGETNENREKSLQFNFVGKPIKQWMKKCAYPICLSYLHFFRIIKIDLLIHNLNVKIEQIQFLNAIKIEKERTKLF